jgi:hypothetical protein
MEIIQTLGTLILWIFSLILPLMIIIYYANKYNNQKIGKSVFYKLPLISFLFSIIGSFVGIFIGGWIMSACSGEECLGTIVLLFLLAFVLFCFSLFLAFANYYFDGFYKSTFWKILCSITNFINKIWIILLILILAMIIFYLLTGIAISSSVQ